MSGPTTPNQWIRKALLVVGKPATPFGSTIQSGIDLSNLHFKFTVTMTDDLPCNTAVIRVYNPTQKTVTAVQTEFSRVVLQAGYQPPGACGVIFDGTIKQFEYGKESNVDTYMDIFAADWDYLYNFGVVKKTLSADASTSDKLDALNQVATDYGAQVDKQAQTDAVATGSVDAPGLVGGVLPRGKVLYNLWRDQARELGRTTGTTWSIQNGVVTVIALNGYTSGDPIIINAQTGMVGMPQSTQNGITLKTLLNPNISIGRRIKLNNKDINQRIVKSQGFPTISGIEYYADPSRDGLFRVCVHEYEGDTRGQPWYSNIVALAIDPTASPGSQILPYG